MANVNNWLLCGKSTRILIEMNTTFIGSQSNKSNMIQSRTRSICYYVMVEHWTEWNSGDGYFFLFSRKGSQVAKLCAALDMSNARNVLIGASAANESDAGRHFPVFNFDASAQTSCDEWNNACVCAIDRYGINECNCTFPPEPKQAKRSETIEQERHTVTFYRNESSLSPHSTDPLVERGCYTLLQHKCATYSERDRLFCSVICSFSL